nr:hypothetical protein [Paenalcaligenes hominis]
MIINHSRDYREARKSGYPEIGDQLDAVFKLAQYLQDIGHPLPPETSRWIEQCQQVKDQYPAN